MAILHKRQRNLLLSLFVLAGFSLSVAQSAARREVPQAERAVPNSPRVSPTPQPSPSPASERKTKIVRRLRRVFDFLKCNAAKQTKEQQLSLGGMQFPAKYDSSDFSIVALVKGDWSVAVVYEMEPSSTASITFEVKDVAPFSETLSATEAWSNQPTAGPHTRVLRLPERFGDRPQAALISFKAVTGAPNGTIPADFQLEALGIGDSAIAIVLFKQPGQTIGTDALQVNASYQGSELVYDFGNWPPIGHKSVAITEVTVTPDKISSSQGGTFNYSFSSAKPFDRWRAEYRRNTKTVLPNGRNKFGTERVGGEPFNEPVSEGSNPQPPPSPNSKQWRIKSRSKPGQYKIQVFASLHVNGPVGGESATKSSELLRIE